MTFVHFVSCLGLTFGPYYLIYKTKLNESRSISMLMYGVFGNIFTQLCKMIILATFFTSYDTSIFNVFQEVIKGMSVLIDLVSIYMILKFVYGSKDAKVLGVGLGWSFASTAMMRLAQLWMGALGQEFSWQYTLDSVESNFKILQDLSMVALTYLVFKVNQQQSKKKDSNVSSNLSLSTVYILLAGFMLYPIVNSYLEHIVQMEPIQILLTNGIYSVSIAFLTKNLIDKE
ncbi:hypothetical protein DLAC_03062 [Tieghemostelium lacteum]|uniref:BOS complex subunit TMEM147 n=1 Tax=Tieghemostelium lacteum TaxID=361077 RepID=A0A152A283_TIELA|nr:hypothetical protein DLAC_03062 [Tieghemostelium lacteum]|eukprot:KYR00319.1 hypothetical protein DLAC_03062 [Tieghemostelium lacteum]